MAATSDIEWTDTTWNPVVGCTKVSPGCARCYAETMGNRLAGMAKSDIEAGRNPGRKSHYLEVIDDKGRWNGKVSLVPEALGDPLKWREPRRVFVNSMSDLFHDDVPDGFIMQVLWTMAHAHRHTFQILTKRPQRMRDFFTRWADRSGEDFRTFKRARGPEATRRAHPSQRGQLFASMLDSMGTPPDGAAYPTFDWMEGMINWPDTFPQIWLGVSVENQKAADERIPLLLHTPAAVRFLSCEPLLGAINLERYLSPVVDDALDCPEGDERDFFKGRWPGIDWTIVGGESGHGARPCNVAWIRSIVEQCTAAAVPVFVKQLGRHVHEVSPGGELKSWFPNDSKGGEPSEWPEDLMVRQFPRTESAQ